MKYIIVFLTFLVLAYPLLSKENGVIPFSIEDQFDNTHTEEKFYGTVTVMIGSARSGSKYSMKWGMELGEKLEKEGLYEQVQFIAHADLRGVPGLLKNFVKNQFPDDEEKWALMDWDGKLAKAFNYNTDASNILLFNRSGELVHHEIGKEPDEETVLLLFNKIKELVRRDQLS